MVLIATFHFELDRPSPLVQWTLFMHGHQSFVSGCGTVVYTLICENVHSSASGSGNIGFHGRCLTLKILSHLLGFQNESVELGSNFMRMVIPSLS